MTIKDELIVLAEGVWLVGTICLAFVGCVGIMIFEVTTELDEIVAVPLGILMMIAVFGLAIWSIIRWIEH